MNKTELMQKVSRTFNKVNFQVKKHSPEILIAVGVVGTVASAIMACKATTKLSGVLDEAKDNIDNIHNKAEGLVEVEDGYTLKDNRKELAIAYGQTGLKLAKLYGPPVMLGTVSLLSIVTSNKILRERYAASVAAYVTIDKSFKDYRSRVVERFGEGLDRELKYNIKAKEIEETIVDEKGKEKKVKKNINVVSPDDISDFARFFDESSPYWEKNAEYNLTFLKAQQRYANDMLKSRGYLYLNEVYDMLGLEWSEAGQIIGWIYDDENPVGDNYVDFGIYDDVYVERRRDFVNGHERSILLDFNVDGAILKKAHKGLNDVGSSSERDEFDYPKKLK